MLKGADFDINMSRGMFIADLIHHSGMLATYGALDPDFVAADDDELAFRLVVVLTTKR